MGSILSISDLWDMVKRRFAVIVGVLLLGTALSVVFALSQQHLYTSSEVLQVQRPKIAQSVTPTTEQSSTARRLQLVEQQVMARDALLETAERLGLFQDARAMRDSDKVDVLRRAVSVSGVAAARQGYSDDGTVSLLRITANWPTPDGAQMLASEFARRTIELSTDARLDQARETLAFFRVREDSLTRDLATLETEIAAFRASNDLTAPGGTEITQREIERLSESIINIDRQMITLQRTIATDPATRLERRQREAAQQDLSRLTEERALLSDAMAALTDTLQGNPEIDLQLAKYDLRLQELRAQLQEAQNRRTEAQISYELETENQLERLTVLESAPLPDYPYTTARKQIVVLGAFASFLAGLVAAFLLDWRRPVIRTAAQMEREIGLRPVITIPEIDTRPARSRRDRDPRKEA